MLAAYRLFVNGLELTMGPGRGDVATNDSSLPGNAIFDTVELPLRELWSLAKKNSTGDGDGGLQLLTALQCYHGNGGAGAWAMLEVRVSNIHGVEQSVFSTSVAPGKWLAVNADPIFKSGLNDSCGRSNEDINATAGALTVGWREPNFTPNHSGNWVHVEARKLAVVPVAKTAAPLHVQHGARPETTQKLANGWWFFDFGSEGAAGVSLVVPKATAAAWTGASNSSVHRIVVEMSLSEEVVFDAKGNPHSKQPQRYSFGITSPPLPTPPSPHIFLHPPPPSLPQLR
jgi:hypothetical protein